MRLRTLQDWVVEPRSAARAGRGRRGQLRRPGARDPRAAFAGELAAYGLTLEELETPSRKASQNASGGILERGAEQFVIRSQGLFRNLDDVARVPVASHDGTPVLVRDVATVSRRLGAAAGRRQPRRRRRHGRRHRADAARREPVGGAGARARRGRRAQRRASCPTGSRWSPFYDRTDLVDTTLHTVGHNLLEGATAGHRSCCSPSCSICAPR